MKMAKVFTYRGKTLNELQSMSLQELAQVMPSRARRSLKKGFNKHLMGKIEKALEVRKTGKFPKPIRTHLRDTIIVPQMVGLLFAVHKGNAFETVEIKQEMLGHYLGEMVMTRRRVTHGKAGIGATRSSTAISARK
jgi:small subunit ribosomal protein S19